MKTNIDSNWTYEIKAIGAESSFYKDRKSFIGKRVRLTDEEYHIHKGPWRAITLEIEDKGTYHIHQVLLKRIKI